MAWTSHFIVWITVVAASAYNCKHASFADVRLHHDYANQEPGIPDNRAYDRINVQSAQILPAYSNAPDNVKSAQLRLGDSTATRTEEAKVLTWKPNVQSRQAVIGDTSKIVFPGPTSEEFRLEIPDHCKKLGICEDVPNYPTEKVKKLLAEISDKDVLFTEDKLDLPDVPDIAQRVGPSEENVELCEFEEKLMYPKAAVDATGNWHIVLQDDNPMQGFKVEICRNVIVDEQTTEIKEGPWDSSPKCSSIAVFVSGYEGRCKQKFVYRKMSVLQDGTKVERSLKVPSCCSCVARLVLS